MTKTASIQPNIGPLPKINLLILPEPEPCAESYYTCSIIFLQAKSRGPKKSRDQNIQKVMTKLPAPKINILSCQKISCHTPLPPILGNELKLFSPSNRKREIPKRRKKAGNRIPQKSCDQITSIQNILLKPKNIISYSILRRE